MEQEPKRARVTLIGVKELELYGEVRRIEGSRTEVVVDTPIEPGQALKLEWGEMLLLGEVRACRPEDRRYSVLVEMEHSVRCTQELARLARALLDA
ncbi:MAG: hypothetical protein ABSD27_01070 [Bryobacteraceae bacterium]|jgi:hypothetical protein